MPFASLVLATCKHCCHVHAQVKRVLHAEVPPRKFWFWWSDGLQVYDALVVAAWVALNVVYVEQRVSRMLRMTKCRFPF